MWTIMIPLLLSVLLTACGASAADSRSSSASQDASASSSMSTGNSEVVSGPFTEDTLIEDVINDPAFDSWGRLIFPVEEGYYSGDTLGELQLAWYNYINPEKTVEIVNYFYENAQQGNQVFYDIYTDEEKAVDPAKEDTGIFFFRGSPGAKTAIVSAGGGFAYVGAMQDSFPVALELSKMGYNAVALIYRPDATTACEDLAHTIAYLEEHADELQIDMTDYSLWGGSAGARMSAWVGADGTAAYGEEEYPQPAIVVTQYTGLSEVTGNEPPTYANVGTADYIADYQVMQNRIDAIRANGTDAEIEVFEGLPHGFGLGEGTVAEGWVDHAVSFWEDHMTTPSDSEVSSASVQIPDEIESVPDGYTEASDQPGTLVDLYYDTWESFSYEEKSTPLTKHAVVYLPYGYDDSRAYDIVYNMHGGWSTENTLLGTPSSPSEFKNILDNAIENGDIEPLIMVCPTYNNTSENDAADFSLALQLTQNYHNELLGDLMPAVESRYHTYAREEADDVSSIAQEALEASRDHRAFVGFSMGSVTTWRTFEYCLDEFRYFSPMSCGTSLDDETIWQAAEGRDPSDYFVFVMTGTSDFAYSYDSRRAERMSDSDYFTSVDDDPANGNFAFRVKEGYEHNGTAVMEYTYNALLAFFPC
ncbi:MAG: alpha/beta hydrolase-fold protein [Oscillospiraceae bacterium]